MVIITHLLLSHLYIASSYPQKAPLRTCTNPWLTRSDQDIYDYNNFDKATSK